MNSESSTQLDLEEIVASFKGQNSVVLESSSSDEENDSVGDVEIVKELKVSLELHQCDLCCKGSFLVNKLLQFGGAINNSTKHACEICCKGFAKKCDLTKHMELHETGVLDFETESEPVRTASAVVTPQTAFTCEICTSRCKSAAGLKRHVSAKHKKVSSTHVCEVCKATFTNFTLFIRHCWTHGSKQKVFSCIICNKRYMSKKNLQNHVCKVE